MERFNLEDLINDNFKAEIPLIEKSVDYKTKSPQFNYTVKSLMNYRRKSSNEINKEVLSQNPKSDIVDFYIKNLTDDNIIQFMAYLDPISDSYNSDWQSERFAGRGEEFFRYVGFSRSLSLGFWVVVEDFEHLGVIIKKLNYLVSLTAPTYSPKGFMQGNILSLTIGNYIKNLPGVLTGVTLDISEDSNWETDYKIQLPILVKVNGFQFKPIHNFLPETGEKFISNDMIDNILENYTPSILKNKHTDSYNFKPQSVSTEFSNPYGTPTISSTPKSVTVQSPTIFKSKILFTRKIPQ